jgi:hypothetical protein
MERFIGGDHVLDDFDCASIRSEIFTEAALSAVLGRLSGPPSTGVCRSCSDAIEPERLKLSPTAKLCACCAAEEEAQSHRRRRCGPR